LTIDNASHFQYRIFIVGIHKELKFSHLLFQQRQYRGAGREYFLKLSINIGVRNFSKEVNVDLLELRIREK